MCWNGKLPRTEEQTGSGANFQDSDFDVINHRHLRYLELHSPQELDRFHFALVVVCEKSICDAINKKKAMAFASVVGNPLVCYRSRDCGPQTSISPCDVQCALCMVSAK